MFSSLLKHVVWIAALVVCGCATLQPAFETPAVNVSSFRALPSGGIAPRFEIGLHIINPNRSALHLKGVAYTVNLEGHRILTGVSNVLPVIEPYGEGTVTLQAGVDLLSSILLIGDLVKQPKQVFSYDLEAKLDLGGIRPNIFVSQTGEIDLSKVEQDD